ncbi:hypothetical protein B2J88_12075 [Rhodococcus sp. SRB_17]|nr:hypothetical protein [Rhodococcus sp. SRB_17]
MKHLLAPLALAGLCLHGLRSAAQAVCSSDGAPQPAALFERFTGAGCEDCWRDPTTPAPGPRALLLDWIVPGTQGDAAPLSAAALPEAAERLQALGRARPEGSDIHTAPVEPVGPGRLRVAQGPPLSDYLGTVASLARSPAARAQQHGPWTLWLVLVQAVPAGTEGTPVARNLVRNVLQLSWDQRNERPPKEPNRWSELRPMRMPDGAAPASLSVAGWLQDAQGHVVAAAQSHCRAGD